MMDNFSYSRPATLRDAAAPSLHDVRELHLFRGIRLDANDRVAQLEIRRRGVVQHRARGRENLLQAAARRRFDSASRPLQRTVAVAAAVVRRHLGVARRRPEHRHRDAEHLAGDHRQRGAAALADVGGREQHVDGAIEVDPDGCARESGAASALGARDADSARLRAGR